MGNVTENRVFFFTFKYKGVPMLFPLNQFGGISCSSRPSEFRMIYAQSWGFFSMMEMIIRLKTTSGQTFAKVGWNQYPLVI